ncbi:MAG: response regulator [Anaerohalosphaera sp.]|nr:response regulator [Anaerohalosphaera sp.]
MSKRVLIIDDDADLRDSMANLLDAKGYSVDTAADGTEGLKKAKENTPNLILLDVMMTTKSEGFDVARELNSLDSVKEVPVIMVSGVRREMNLPFGFEPDEKWLPIKEFLEKPVKPQALLDAVEKYIAD